MARHIFPANMSALHAKSVLPVVLVEANLGSRKEIAVADKVESPRKMAESMKLKIHKPGRNPATRAALSSVAAELSSIRASGTEADGGINSPPCQIP